MSANLDRFHAGFRAGLVAAVGRAKTYGRLWGESISTQINPKSSTIPSDEIANAILDIPTPGPETMVLSLSEVAAIRTQLGELAHRIRQEHRRAIGDDNALGRAEKELGACLAALALLPASEPKP